MLEGGTVVKGKALLGAVGLGLILAACSAGDTRDVVAAGPHGANAAAASGAKGAELRVDLRKLWEDHITWTRLFIVSATEGLKDKDATAQRLLRNQDDIGNAIKAYYGDAAGAQLTKLLREHILTAAELLGAAKAGDAAKLDKAKTAWYANADAISAFLSNANPSNWPLDAVKKHMRMHLDLTLDEAVARLEGRYTDEIAAYDKIHDAILELSDTIAAGIVAQFPDRFAA
jgi:hypothetical protein